MSGRRLLRVTHRENGVAKLLSRQLGNKAKNPSKLVHILLPDKFIITFYIIQLNWLCLDHNLVGIISSEAPVVSEIATGSWDDLSSYKM